MKNTFLLLFLFISTNVLSQEKKIVDLLNQQLRKEIKESGNDDSLKILQAYHIDENKS